MRIGHTTCKWQRAKDTSHFAPPWYIKLTFQPYLALWTTHHIVMIHYIAKAMYLNMYNNCAKPTPACS